VAKITCNEMSNRVTSEAIRPPPQAGEVERGRRMIALHHLNRQTPRSASFIMS
jgi:hypothetical protein